MIRVVWAVLLVVAGPGLAAAQDMADAPGAKLRLLDKLTGAITDVDLQNGQSTGIGRLTITLDQCRYPADNATAEAEAHVSVAEANKADPSFSGWMVASSPALSALDHPRYDVWVLRCDVPDLVLAAPADAPADVVDPAPVDPNTLNPAATDPALADPAAAPAATDAAAGQ